MRYHPQVAPETKEAGKAALEAGAKQTAQVVPESKAAPAQPAEKASPQKAQAKANSTTAEDKSATALQAARRGQQARKQMKG